MRGLILLALAIAIPCGAQTSSSQHAGIAPWMTGERLLALVTFPPHVKGGLDMTHEQYLDAEHARAYMEGVHDNSERKSSWCYSKEHQPKPDVMREAVEMGLRKLPPEQLKRNAADLIVEIWSKRWPCAGRKDAQ